MNLVELERAVERRFADTAAGLANWADPHPPPDRIVADDEYSRVTDPGRWRIVGARADAWVGALLDTGLATVVAAPVEWPAASTPAVTRHVVVVPRVRDGLRMVVARSRFDVVDDAGLVIGVERDGGPAAVVTWFPDCGCDACDSGSQDELDRLDEVVIGIVDGTFRLLECDRQRILVFEPGHREARDLPGRHPRDLIDRILADPVGWEEWTGPSWLAGR